MTYDNINSQKSRVSSISGLFRKYIFGPTRSPPLLQGLSGLRQVTAEFHPQIVFISFTTFITGSNLIVTDRTTLLLACNYNTNRNNM